MRRADAARQGHHRAARTPERRRSRTYLVAVVGLIGATAGSMLVAGQLRDLAAAGDFESAPAPARPFEVSSDLDVDSARLESRSPPGAGDALPTFGERVRGEDGCELTVEPQHVVIPSLCVSTPITGAVVTAQGELDLNPGVSDVSIWQDGARVSDPSGTVLIAGHVVYGEEGPGPFADLHTIAPRDLIYVTDDQVVTAWQAVTLEAAKKEALPEQVFAGRDGPKHLTLVTCAGKPELRPGQGYVYPDNTVVGAVPVTSRSGLA